MTPHTPIDHWLAAHAVRLDGTTYEPLETDAPKLAAIDALLGDARIVFLGETNHFVHEKADFRLWFLRRLAARGRLVVVEELGWSDGRDVARYLADGDASHLDHAATFGDRRHTRDDRDDTPTGVLRASFEAYPTTLFKAEQVRFYRALRALGPLRYYGCDIDAPGTGYEDVAAYRSNPGAMRWLPAAFWSALDSVAGESLAAEADRVERALHCVPCDGATELDELRQDLRAMIETLRYTALAHPACDYEALRPAMAYREDAMKRRLEWIESTLAPDETLVVMAHAFHLAKDDAAIGASAGVGPGGDRVHSLGHHLTHTLGVDVCSIWMLYGGGDDSQPFPDLPRTAAYPPDSLNARLARCDAPFVAPVAPAGDVLEGRVGVGHLYNSVVPVHLPSLADALFFVPRVTPLRES